MTAHTGLDKRNRHIRDQEQPLGGTPLEVPNPAREGNHQGTIAVIKRQV